jgi:hypothetical protein
MKQLLRGEQGSDSRGVAIMAGGGLSLLVASVATVVTYETSVPAVEQAEPVNLFVNCLDEPYGTDTWEFPDGTFSQPLRVVVGDDEKVFTVRREAGVAYADKTVLTADSIGKPLFIFDNLVVYPGRAAATGDFAPGDQAISLACPAAVSYHISDPS